MTAARIFCGDCRAVMPAEGPFDMIVADPPYGDTSLEWDRRVRDWLGPARESLKPTGSMWLFGSMRFLMETADDLRIAGWQYAQDVVWEKHNGSGFHADRFRRVHEHAVQFYRTDAPWSGIYNDVQTTPDALPRRVRRKLQPAHTGRIETKPYVSVDGGPRLMRSVIYVPSVHGRAIHGTEKPAWLLEVLVRTSCPPGGLVGDWFAGSAAVGEACLLSGRRYVGSEIVPAIAASAQARLEGSLFSRLGEESTEGIARA